MNTSARMIPVAAATMTLVLGLSACSVLPKAAPMVTYKLPDYHIAQAESTPRAVPGPGALRVYAPESSRVLDSERLFIAQPDGRLSAWQGVRWADPAPVLLRDRIVEAFMRDGRSTSVITDSTPMSADMELRSTLRAFQLEYLSLIHI